MAHDVFISYSSIDKETADAVCSMLEQNGISCWMAPRNITPGIPFAEAIIDGIKSSKVFILVYSSNSNNSVQVIREVDRAVHHGLSVINLRLEDVPLSKQLEYYISSVHWLDAVTPPLEKHLHQLCQVVQMFLKPGEVKEAEIAEALRRGIIKQSESAEAGKESRMAKKRRTLILGIIGAIVILIVSLVIFNIGGIRQARAGSIDSIVILPFGNYTGTDTLDPYISGMHSLLINELGKIEGLRVISKVSSDSYKNTGKTIPQIAKELNVDAAIELGVLCFGDSICVQPRLISGGTEERQLWIGDYREYKGNLFNLYNQIIRQIAGEVKISLTPAENARLAELITIDPGAMDEYLKGFYLLGDFSEESLFKARGYLNSAIEKDPDWAPFYAGLAYLWIGIAQAGLESPDVAYKNVYENLDKALKLDQDLADGHYIKGMAAYLNEWDWDKGEQELVKYLDVNPNDASARIYYAQLLGILQRPDEARIQGQWALELDPLNPLIQILYSYLLVEVDDCEAALNQLERVIAVDPDNLIANSVLECAAYRCNDYKKAFDATKNTIFNIINEDAHQEIEQIFQEKGFAEAYKEIMRHLELFFQGNSTAPVTMAIGYVYANQPDKAIDYIEKGYEMRDPNMPYIATPGYNLDPLFDNPRFIEIVRKMNLPLLGSL